MRGRKKVGFVLTSEQIKWLKDESDRLEVPVSEVLRRLIDKEMGR